MKKAFCAVFYCIIFSSSSFAADNYNLVRFNISGPSDLQRIASLGLDIVHVKQGYYAEAVVRDLELEKLQAQGIFPEIIIEDMTDYYRRNKTGEGIFGNYQTYSEVLASLDSVSNAHPQIVSQRIILPNNTGDNTWDGNQIWAIKVSDNVGVQEDEPEVMICALHHAREPIGPAICVHFLHWLADNYGTDEDATWIVDNRQVWIVPIVNPDGYVYNETTYGYGGMWRKNRRNSGSGNYGVDPNRNYTYRWGYDNNGSSPDPSDDTYRGPSAASEPEIQSMINFYRNHEFKSCIDYHSHGGLYLIPWGYINQPTADEWVFDSLTHMMASANGYSCGRPGELLYNVNGGSIDFGYGDSLKPKIMHVSPEVGTAFWQDDMMESQIAENQLANQIVCWTAGLYLRAVEVTADKKDLSIKDAEPGDTVSLSVEILNYAAFDTGFSVSVSLSTDDPYVEFIDATASYGNMNPLQKKNNGSDSLIFAVSPETPQGWIVVIEVTATAQGGYKSVSKANLMVGIPQNGFYDDFESGSSNWSLAGIWQLRTTYYHSPTHSLGTGTYGNDQNISATMSSGVDFPVSLGFWTVHDLENGYDYGYVEISSSENPAWVNLLSVNGENQFTWQYKEVDMSGYASHHDVKVRFRLSSDSYITGGGWYVDDIALLSSSYMDSVPSAPSPVSPANGSTVTSQAVLIVGNSSDPNSLPLTYAFKVYSDSFCTDLVRVQTGIVQGGGGQTSWVISPSLPVGTYYWRCYADNGHFRSLMSDEWSFGVASSVEESQQNMERFSCGQYGFRGYYLHLPFDCIVSIDFFDITGRNVRNSTMNMSQGMHSFESKNLPGGVYFVKVKIEGADGRRESSFRFNVLQ